MGSMLCIKDITRHPITAQCMPLPERDFRDRAFKESIDEPFSTYSVTWCMWSRDRTGIPMAVIKSWHPNPRPHVPGLGVKTTSYIYMWASVQMQVTLLLYFISRNSGRRVPSAKSSHGNVTQCEWMSWPKWINYCHTPPVCIFFKKLLQAGLSRQRCTSLEEVHGGSTKEGRKKNICHRICARSLFQINSLQPELQCPSLLCRVCIVSCHGRNVTVVKQSPDENDIYIYYIYIILCQRPNQSVQRLFRRPSIANRFGQVATAIGVCGVSPLLTGRVTTSFPSLSQRSIRGRCL